MKWLISWVRYADGTSYVRHDPERNTPRGRANVERTAKLDLLRGNVDSVKVEPTDRIAQGRRAV